MAMPAIDRNRAAARDADEHPTPWLLVGAMTVYLLALPFVFVDGIIDILRNVGNAGGMSTIRIGLVEWGFAGTVDTRGLLVALAFLAGGLGATVHAGQSLSSYVGNRVFRASWAPWIILRPVLGAALAVIFHIVVTAGFLEVAAAGAVPSAGAVMALAALVGLFSKQATDRLGDVADKVFRNKADPQRKDGLREKPVRVDVKDPAGVDVKDAADVDAPVKVPGKR